ncbi:MAG TPA: putative metal-binding motif-containing protein, partial [Myxococcota bacterium]|nr:putative metal-binding motif-containing protein [Myxococcota bacterium]
AAAQSPTFATAQEARALLAVPSSLSASAGLLSAMEQATTAQTLSVYNDNFVGDAAQYMTDNRRLTLFGATVAQQGVDGQGLRRDQEERIFDASNPDTDIREVDASLHLLLEGGSDPQSGVINRESSAETDTYASSFNGTQVAASSSDITNQEWGQLLRASGERELFSHTTRQWDEDYVDNYWLTTSRHFSFDGFEGQNSSYAVDYLATQMDFDRNDGDLTSTRDEQASIVYSSSSNTTEVSYTLSYAYLLYWDVLISQFVTTKQFDYTAQASDGTHLLSIENNATLQLCGVDFWTLMGGSSSEPVQDVGWATLDGSSFLVFLETWEEVVAPDQDGDGWMEGYGDCNDADAAVQPCAVELCNGVDDNCNGLLDDVTTGGSCWYVDGDGDGYGVTATALLSETQPAGYVADCGDCNDADTAISPGEAEFCDGRDEDCSGVVDDHPTDGSRWYRDQDVDGAGTPEDVVVACTEPEGYVATGGDCNDSSAAQSPFLDEVCDNLDNNCDGRLDENALDASTWYLDVDDDDFGALHLPIRSCDRPRSGSAISGDCNDLDPAIAPDYPEVCGDRIDNNCADGIDEGCPEEEEEENVEEKEEQQREPKVRASEPACGCSTSAPTGMYAFPLFLLWRRRKP